MKKGFMMIVCGLLFLTMASALFGETRYETAYRAEVNELVRFFLRVNNLYILKQAGFTNEQIARLKDWQEEARTRYHRLRQVEMKIQRETREELLSSRPSQERLENLVNRRYQLRKKAELAQLRLVIRVRELLGEEKFIRLVRNLKRLEGMSRVGVNNRMRGHYGWDESENNRQEQTKKDQFKYQDLKKF